MSDDVDEDPQAISRRLQAYHRVLLTGPDASVLAQALGSHYKGEIILDPRSHEGIGTALLEIGIRAFQANGPDPDDQGPVYIRGSDAELGILAPRSQSSEG